MGTCLLSTVVYFTTHVWLNVYCLGTDLGFVDTFLDMQKNSLCSAEDPCFTAYDDTIGGRVDLTDSIQLGKLTAVSRGPRYITFALPFFVSDSAGKVVN